MDVIIGLVVNGLKTPFNTCVFANNYNDVVRSGKDLCDISGSRIQIVAVFLGHGWRVQQIQVALQELQMPCADNAWFASTPGEVVDQIHAMLAPGSVANAFMRSMDRLIESGALPKCDSKLKSMRFDLDPTHEKPIEPEVYKKPTRPPRKKAAS